MRKKTEQIRIQILKEVNYHSLDLVNHISSMFNISRQSVYRHINNLIKEQKLSFDIIDGKRVYKYGKVRELSKLITINKDVSESDIYANYFIWVEQDLKENVKAIVEYGFTEILNNVIDHSESKTCFVYVKRDLSNITIIINDEGEGIFNRITRLKKLSDTRQALLELKKGKLTTDAEHHSGEGIFFSSKAFDEFVIISGDLTFIHENKLKNDYLLDQKPGRGTYVKMKIDINSEKKTYRYFDEFAEADEYAFNKTIVPVILAKFGNENLMSRSQAKRLLTRLENFKTVIFDFRDVNLIGQAFADEIFRVYANKHKDIKLEYVNINSDIEKMILRALNHK
ncbi:STAS-like domain-containing protein [Francisella tularensis]|nr:STAS-like domain-containing protein [Francisella tularensis]